MYPYHWGFVYAPNSDTFSVFRFQLANLADNKKCSEQKIILIKEVSFIFLKNTSKHITNLSMKLLGVILDKQLHSRTKSNYV